jgi:AcrR family transcriptional regulator
MTVNRRTHSRRRSRHSPGSDRAAAGHKPRTQAERRAHTRQALLDAVLEQMDEGSSFDTLSLRSVTRAAGVVPAAFYRHFASMDELGLALVDESFRTLRAGLREVRANGLPPKRVIRRSVELLIEQVLADRRHFAFIAYARTTGNGVLRHAVSNEIRLLTSELATDLARFPALREWTTEDLLMLAGLLVNTMIMHVAEILDLPTNGGGPSEQALAEIARVAEKQLRLPLLAVPHWRSSR